MVLHMNRVNVIAKDADKVTESAGVETAYDEGNNAAEGGWCWVQLRELY